MADEVQEMWDMMQRIAAARGQQLKNQQPAANDLENLDRRIGRDMLGALESTGFPTQKNMQAWQQRNLERMQQEEAAQKAAQDQQMVQQYQQQQQAGPADQAVPLEGAMNQIMQQRQAAEQMGDVEHGLQGQQMADEQMRMEELEQMMANDPSMAEQILMKLKAQAQQAVQTTGQGAAQGIGVIQNLMNRF